MKSIEKLPVDPYALAAKRAEESALSSTDAFEITPDDEWRITELDYAADTLGFIGKKYFIESRRSLSVPVSWEDEENVTRIDFKDLTFEGSFTTYSQLVIGRVIGGHSVRALCATFHDTTLLPYFDTLPEDHLLHVPVLAIQSISESEA